MRSLFFRIFVSFMAGTVLIGVLLLVLALTAKPERIIFVPHEERLTRLGKEMLCRVPYRRGRRPPRDPGTQDPQRGAAGGPLPER